MYLYVGSGFKKWNSYYYHYYYYHYYCYCYVFSPFSPLPPSFVSFSFPFSLEFIQRVCASELRCVCCGGGVACYVEYTNVIKIGKGVIMTTGAIKGAEVWFSHADHVHFTSSIEYFQLCEHDSEIEEE